MLWEVWELMLSSAFLSYHWLTVKNKRKSSQFLWKKNVKKSFIPPFLLFFPFTSFCFLSPHSILICSFFSNLIIDFCNYSCRGKSEAPHPGRCPAPDSLTCRYIPESEQCGGDADCQDKEEKCCYNGCSYTCEKHTKVHVISDLVLFYFLIRAIKIYNPSPGSPIHSLCLPCHEWVFWQVGAGLCRLAL